MGIVGAGRWNEIKRGEATRLKGKAGPTLNWTASVGCSRRHLYSREIVIDRSEKPNGFVAPFPPFFISYTLERNEIAREHRHLSCQGFRRNILAHTRCKSQSESVTVKRKYFAKQIGNIPQLSYVVFFNATSFSATRRRVKREFN